MYCWSKTVRPDRVAAWSEQIVAVVDLQRLAVHTPANGKLQRLEVYCPTPGQAETLRALFGGSLRKIRPQTWQPLPATAPGRPIAIGGLLLVTGRPDEIETLRAARPDRHILCIPAAMAFGTGEHATTAMCLRLLVHAAKRQTTHAWDTLDLGMGSGILALAARLLGARTVLGLDNDPHAVRTAKENARLNELAGRTVQFQRADLPLWTPPAGRTWRVVTANLFSELLIRLLPGVIAPALTQDGDLILSGVLATQAAEVAAAVHTSGLKVVALKASGRWRALHCRHA